MGFKQDFAPSRILLALGPRAADHHGFHNTVYLPVVCQSFRPTYSLLSRSLYLSEHPTLVQTVELFGSWDNFSKPYQLQRDRRRGRGTWAGCFSFENIICDGDLKNLGQQRNGALKMGGTYWYYVSTGFHLHTILRQGPLDYTTWPEMKGHSPTVLTLNFVTVPSTNLFNISSHLERILEGQHKLTLLSIVWTARNALTPLNRQRLCALYFLVSS